MQVIVEIDAEEDLEAEITNVRVELFGTSDDPPEPENQSFPSPHTWPFVAVLAPQNRDVTRRFRVQATASVGARTIITRASSGFAPDRTWHLRLRFERACLDLPCEVESSCRSGRCEGAEVPVAGEDAGAGMSSETGVDATGDVSFPRDAACVPTGASETACNDGCDNDGDGFPDCADPDCLPLPESPASDCMQVNVRIEDELGHAGVGNVEGRSVSGVVTRSVRDTSSTTVGVQVGGSIFISSEGLELTYEQLPATLHGRTITFPTAPQDAHNSVESISFTGNGDSVWTGCSRNPFPTGESVMNVGSNCRLESRDYGVLACLDDACGFTHATTASFTLPPHSMQTLVVNAPTSDRILRSIVRFGIHEGPRGLASIGFEGVVVRDGVWNVTIPTGMSGIPIIHQLSDQLGRGSSIATDASVTSVTMPTLPPSFSLVDRRIISSDVSATLYVVNFEGESVNTYHLFPGTTTVMPQDCASVVGQWTDGSDYASAIENLSANRSRMGAQLRSATAVIP